MQTHTELKNSVNKHTNQPTNQNKNKSQQRQPKQTREQHNNRKLIIYYKAFKPATSQ